MKEQPEKSWEFDITSASEVRGSLEDEFLPVGDIRILTDGSSSPDQNPYREDSLFGAHLSTFANSIVNILGEDSVRVELDASDIQFTPISTPDAVRIHVDIHGVPDELLDSEPDLITTEAFAREVYCTLSNWYEEAYTINPELTEREWFQDFEVALGDAERTMKAADIDSDDTPPTG